MPVVYLIRSFLNYIAYNLPLKWIQDLTQSVQEPQRDATAILNPTWQTASLFKYFPGPLDVCRQFSFIYSFR
jgi:hypothetical protein